MNDTEEYNPRLKALLLEVVDNQIRDNDPPIVAITLNRLMSEGYSKEQAKEKICAVLVEDIYYIMTDDESFDEKTYESQLSQLK